MKSIAQGEESRSRQVAKQIEADIRSGIIKPDSRLDRVRNLAESYGVSLRVIVSALNLLEDNRLIQRKPRRGIFVAHRIATKKFLILRSESYDYSGLFANVILPFESECFHLNIHVDHLELELFDSQASINIVNEIKGREYSGVLLMGSGFIGNESLIRRLRELEIPVVIPRGTSYDSEITGFSTLYMDKVNAWRDAIKFLYDSGYRNIGVIGRLGNGERTLRCGTIEQHVEIMHEFGLRVQPRSLCFVNPFDGTAFKRELDNFMCDHRRLDVIICGSDMYAVRLYNHCFEHGINIPDDLAVFSYGYLHGGNLLRPVLANLDPGYQAIAKKAVELLNTGDRCLARKF